MNFSNINGNASAWRKGILLVIYGNNPCARFNKKNFAHILMGVTIRDFSRGKFGLGKVG